MPTVEDEYLRVVQLNFEGLKSLGDKSLAQLKESDFHSQLDAEANSIAIIIQHLHGNMLSRFTDFLTTDGEKPTRNRDNEFEPAALSQNQLLERWEAGWQVVMDTLASLTGCDLLRTIYIRNQPHTVLEALNRQVAHYGAHVGQIILLAKHSKQADWKTLSIPKKGSKAFNQAMFGQKPI
ncbi:MAG: DUF1572 family protein [Bacteroidota bacterium]